MSTAWRSRWLKCLLSVILLFGLTTLAPAEDDAPPDGISIFFWVCAIDNEVLASESGKTHTCCDGSFCYICTTDMSLCRIYEDPDRASSSQKIELDSIDLNVRPLKENPSESRLESVCKDARANFASLDSFGYSCVKPDCNGKGDYCAIICPDDRRCTAHTPDVIKGPVSLRGILQNGDNIDRSPTPESKSKKQDEPPDIFIP
jgi:hypothetical protein